MTAIWVTADLHVGHAKVAGIRGFSDTASHDAELVRRWNRAVNPLDKVIILGDVTMGSLGNARPVLRQLLGSKLDLVSGNHDDVWPGHRNAHMHQHEWLEIFASVQPFMRRRLEKQDVLFSHFPYDGDHTKPDRYVQFRLRDEGKWLVHGHVHDAWKQRGRQINAGLDAWDMTPVRLDEIIKMIRNGEADIECPPVTHRSG